MSKPVNEVNHSQSRVKEANQVSLFGFFLSVGVVHIPVSKWFRIQKNTGDLLGGSSHLDPLSVKKNRWLLSYTKLLSGLSHLQLAFLRCNCGY